MTHPASPERPIATKCGHCGYTNGGRFSVCPLCKTDQRESAANAGLGGRESPRVSSSISQSGSLTEREKAPSPLQSDSHPSNDADYWEPDYERDRKPELSEYEENFWDDYRQRVEAL